LWLFHFLKMFQKEMQEPQNLPLLQHTLVKRCFIFYTLLFSQCVQRKKVNLNLEAKAPLRCRLS
jgi:surface polysaccharide O-acyltransferase-like enzyme